MKTHTLKYTDKEIIRCLETGDNNSVLEHLYKEIYPRVKGYILINSGSEDDAFDIFQDAVIALCKQISLGRYDDKYELGGFLFSVSKNLWINKAKRERRQIRMPENMDISDNYDFSDDIVTEEKASALKAITGKLGEKCYELLKYSVFYKASSEEIIEKMGFATANAVKTQKYKCKQKLFKILEENPELNEVIE